MLSFLAQKNTVWSLMSSVLIRQTSAAVSIVSIIPILETMRGFCGIQNKFISNGSILLKSKVSYHQFISVYVSTHHYNNQHNQTREFAVTKIKSMQLQMKLKIGVFSILMIYLANFEAFLFKFLSGAVQNQKLLSMIITDTNTILRKSNDSCCSG